jgi:pimeloyl-ACP methyl ester carboxylesterase
MSGVELRYLEHADRRLAYRRRDGASPGLLFLPGYASDMEGTKAEAIDAFAERQGLAMLRFDYSGTGSSSGDFSQGTLDLWLEESLDVLDHLTTGPLIVIGSSMGGWIAMHLALRRPERVRALLGIAAAPDFTDWGFATADVAEQQGIGRHFWESGQRLRLLEDEIGIDCPVRLVHGDVDEEVPIAVAHQAMNRLRSADVQLLTIKGGGHRLSEPREIQAILRVLAGLLEQAE